MVISDNGTEFTSNAILGWAEEQRIAWHYTNGYSDRPT